MKTENKHKDDFKKLFDKVALPDVPKHLEEQLMEKINKSRISSLSKRQSPFSLNLALFCLSVFILSLLTLFQYFTDWEFLIIFQLKKIVLISVGIFLIMWLMELIDVFLQSKPKHLVLN